jgi:hypothetical protein
MTTYDLLLFAHVSGAIALVTGIGVWLFGALALRRVGRVEQVRAIVGPMLAGGNLVVGSVILLAAAGIGMALLVWGWRVAWIDVSAVSVVLLGLIGPLIVEPRMRAIEREARATPDGPLPAALAARLHDPVVATGLQTMLAGLFGIVFLMTNKPDIERSVAAMAIAVALGVVSASHTGWRLASAACYAEAGRVMLGG